MKRRVIKKWVNRFIAPIVKDMPEIKGRHIEVYNPEDPMQLIHNYTGENIKVVNGKRVNEGEIAPRTRGLFNDIKDTAYELKRQVEGKPNLYHRMSEAQLGYGMYVRVLSFDYPEGFVICEDE
ncbi:hypothetical protein [Paenibacillus tundrae]